MDLPTALLESLSVQALGIEALGVEALCIQTLRVQALGIQALCIQALCVQAFRIEALGVKGLAAQGLGVQRPGCKQLLSGLGAETEECFSVVEVEALLPLIKDFFTIAMSVSPERFLTALRFSILHSSCQTL